MAGVMLFLCSFLCFQIVLSQIESMTEESCKTVEGDVGRCVTLKSCAPYVLLLQQEPLSQQLVALLTAANCGFDKNNPMVCCPESPPGSSTIHDSPLSSVAVTSKDTPFLTPPVYRVTNASPGRLEGGIDAKIEYVTEESCKTVEGDVGRCVTLKSCAPYVLLLQQEPLSQQLVALLTAANCGFDKNNPMVCCPVPSPESSTPHNVPVSPVTVTSSETNLTVDLQGSFLKPPNCGVSNASSGRVVGGDDAKLGDLPWICLLGYLERGRSDDGADDVTKWRCGGSLVSSRYVLTAAHCIHHHEKDLYVVRLGELDLKRDDEAAPVDVLIASRIQHEDYDVATFSNDIGLLILERDVEFSELIRPICLPTQPYHQTNTFVDYNPMVAGWGRTAFNGPTSSRLRVAQVQVVDERKCREAYSVYPVRIDQGVICAQAGGRDACEGDSGGPLVQPLFDPEEKVHYFYQIGVIAYGRGCAESGFPGVYSRVTHYMPWIQRHMADAVE